jgi:hypothetical protein
MMMKIMRIRVMRMTTSMTKMRIGKMKTILEGVEVAVEEVHP